MEEEQAHESCDVIAHHTPNHSSNGLNPVENSMKMNILVPRASTLASTLAIFHSILQQSYSKQSVYQGNVP